MLAASWILESKGGGLPERHNLSLGAIADRGWILENPSVPNAQGGGGAEMLPSYCLHTETLVLGTKHIFWVKYSLLKIDTSKMWDARLRFVTEVTQLCKIQFPENWFFKNVGCSSKICYKITQLC